MVSKYCVHFRQLPVTLPGKAQFSIKTLAERQVFFSKQRDLSRTSASLQPVHHVPGMGLGKQCLCLQYLLRLSFNSQHGISLNCLAWQLGPFVIV